MSEQSPAFPFYASDYLGSSKVQRMSLEEEGAYIRLLAYQWEDGFVPADLTELSRMCKTSPRKMAVIWERLQGCFISLPDDPGKIINERLEEIRKEQADFRQSKSQAGRLGGLRSGEARAKQKGSTASDLLAHSLQANAKQNEPSPFPSPSVGEKPPIAPRSGGEYSPEFERFWKAYPRRKSKGDAWKAWKKIAPSPELQQKILESLAVAIRSEDWRKDSGQFIPYPASWLYSRGWEDEPVETKVVRMPL